MVAEFFFSVCDSNADFFPLKCVFTFPQKSGEGALGSTDVKLLSDVSCLTIVVVLCGKRRNSFLNKEYLA
jgi:hypothetical protein